jgi:hypothetical protein
MSVTLNRRLAILHKESNESIFHTESNESILHTESNESILHTESNESILHRESNESILHWESNESENTGDIPSIFLRNYSKLRVQIPRNLTQIKTKLK